MTEEYRITKGQNRFELFSEFDTLRLGSCLAETAEAGDVILLEGDLGAGKTTLVRGFLHALGHKGAVKSPTYTLVEPYDLNDMVIYHFDLYRLADPEELEWIGGREYFSNVSICLVEWPEKAIGYLPQANFIVKLNYQESGRIADIIFNTDVIL